MNVRSNTIAYFEDLARRNNSVQHDPATAAARRFWMLADADLMPGYPNNTGWNMFLMPFQGRGPVEGYTHTNVMACYRIMKHVKQLNEAVINTTVNEAFDIAWEVWLQINEHWHQCMAGETPTRLSSGIEHLRYVDPASLRFYEVKDFDNFYGYEFSFNCRVDTPLAVATTSGNWRNI